MRKISAFLVLSIVASSMSSCSYFDRIHEKQLDKIYEQHLSLISEDYDSFVIYDNKQNRKFVYINSDAKVFTLVSIDHESKDIHTRSVKCPMPVKYIAGQREDELYCILGNVPDMTLASVWYDGKEIQFEPHYGIIKDILFVDEKGINPIFTVLGYDENWNLNIYNLQANGAGIDISVLHRSVWTAWNEPIPNGAPWNENVDGYGDYMLIGLFRSKDIT